MDDSKNLLRVYGEQEIGRLLERATEIQLREASTTGSSGVTLAELEEIAAEAGIDATYLRRAAMELDASVGAPSFWSRVVGEDLIIARETTIPGELTQEGFERVLGTIQANSREHGEPSLLGRTLTWRAATADKMRMVQIVVAAHSGHTRVRIEENLSQTAAGLFLGTMTGAGMGLGLGLGIPIGLELLGSALLAAAAPIGLVGLSYLGCRAVYRAMVRRRRRASGRLFERVVAEAEASIADARTRLPEGEEPRALTEGSAP